MAFESANRTLSESFAGTHSHCAVICRRYLETQELASCVVENDRAAELLQEWSNLKKPSEKNFSKDVLLLPGFTEAWNFFLTPKVFLDRSWMVSTLTRYVTKDVPMVLIVSFSFFSAINVSHAKRIISENKRTESL